MDETLGTRDMEISVVIPVLNAAQYLEDLLPAIFAQRGVNVKEVVLVDSMSTDATRVIASGFERVSVVEIQNFSHGRARNLGVRKASCEFVVLMTQDARPADDRCFYELVLPLLSQKIAATFSRQVPRSNASPMEQYFLRTHFPPGEQVVMSRSGDSPLSFQREVFLSNVSAAFRREVLLEFPFDEDLIMSEDQQFARDALTAGYSVIYRPSSVVIHSHHYSLAMVFKRYFDSVYSVTELFGDHGVKDSAVMGGRYLLGELRFILSKHPLWLLYYFLYVCAKALGTIMGHFADRMPRKLAMRMSMHRYYWIDK